MNARRESGRIGMLTVQALACIGALLLIGCDAEDDPVDDLYAGIAVSAVGNPRVSAVATHTDGTMVVALEELGQSGVKSVVYIDGNGETFTAMYDRSRKPIQAHSSGFTFVYDSYRGSTVEVGLVDQSGVPTILRGVGVDADLLAIRRLPNFHENIQVAASALLVSGCAAAQAVASNGGAIVNPCQSPLLGTLSDYPDSELTAVEKSATSIGVVAALPQCTPELPIRCAGLVADVGLRLSLEAESAIAKLASDIPTIVAALRFGGLWAARETDHDWFLVEPTGIAYVTERDTCFEFNRGKFLNVNGNVFTYRDLATRFVVPGEYTVSADGAVLSVFGYDQRKWDADRSERNPSELAPECAPPT